MAGFIKGIFIVFAAFAAMVSIALWQAEKRKRLKASRSINAGSSTMEPHPTLADVLEMDHCQSSADWIAAIERGLPVSVLNSFARRYGLLPETFLDDISAFGDAPLYLENRTRLSPLSSDTLVRLAALYGRAENVLDGADQARQWMQAPNFSLGDVAPVVYARTWIGTRAVENLLGQIEHGVAV